MILERATGKAVTTYLQEKIWTPVGMEFGGSWSLDSEKTGFEKMESGLNARAIDFAKLGRLYLNGGKWNGKQIVPADWAAKSTRDNGLLLDPQLYYGYMWWGKRCDPNSHDFFALGDFGQFVYVSTAKNLIIVRNGEQYGLAGEGKAWLMSSVSSPKPCLDFAQAAGGLGFIRGRYFAPLKRARDMYRDCPNSVSPQPKPDSQK